MQYKVVAQNVLFGIQLGGVLLEVTMHSIRYQVTTWFICEWLLCKAFYNMLLLLNVTKNSVVIGYHVFLLKV